MFKGKLSRIVFGVIFAAIISIAIFFHLQYVPPILMYHSVTIDAQKMLEVSVKSFQRQMHFLKRHNYNIIPLRDLAALIKDKKRIPFKTVVLTFDDGYKNVYTYAFPVLQQYGFPATLFIIVGEVGRPQGDRLSWDEIKLMRDSGLIDFGSHCLGPEPLINIKSQDTVRKEIFDSKRILEESLGVKVNTFSYPEGRFTSEIRQMVIDAGYAAAVTTNPGKKFPNDDVFALKRLRISSTSDNISVFLVESSGYYNFMREWRRK